MTGLSEVNYANPGSTNRVHTYMDQFSRQQGKHSLKVGAAIFQIGYFNQSAGTCLFGCATFGSRVNR